MEFKMLLTYFAIFVSIVVAFFAIYRMRYARLAAQETAARLDRANVELANKEKALKQVEQRFASIVAVDAEQARVEAVIVERNAQIDNLDKIYSQRAAAARKEFEDKVSESDRALAKLSLDYYEKKNIYDRLVNEVAIFDERISFAEMGVYSPHFEFDDSEEFKEAINQVRERQKKMISAKTAVFCRTTWTVDGSQSKGQTMTNRGIRLTLRAFNNECDAAISNTRWNNANAMEKRIIRAREQIDKMNASSAIAIDNEYIKLKLVELYLTHEYKEKIKSEREERAEVARLAKEEQRLLRDMENAREEEEYYARMLAKAKAEADQIAGPKLSAFEDQIRTLEKDLAEAHARVERAQALAERTRSGYVYIISNIGSFGEGVVKIGLTRRLDPLDRVRELGDASVPFIFDTHAIIYSDDAPALERALHSEFESTRINAQNYRKEFFKANIDDVEEAVKRLAPGAPFFKDVEAQEYRETLIRRQQALMGTEPEREVFPAAI